MTTKASTKQERSIGIHGWLVIPAADFTAALDLPLDGRLGKNVVDAVTDGQRRDAVEIGVPVLSIDEATQISVAGIAAAA